MSFLDIPAAHGRLEGLWWKVENPRGAAVMCHPHPLAGGTMHNHVTYRSAQAFRDAGVSVLRFNFRGVGRSTGTHDHGRGEVEDVRAALDWVAANEPNVPLYLGGFSFGCRAALALAVEEKRVQRCLAVGLAVDIFDVEFVTEVKQKTAFVHGDKDEYGKLETLEALLKRVKGEHRLFVVPDSDHLATGRLDALSAQLKPALEWLLT